MTISVKQVPLSIYTKLQHTLSGTFFSGHVLKVNPLSQRYIHGQILGLSQEHEVLSYKHLVFNQFTVNGICLCWIQKLMKV